VEDIERGMGKSEAVHQGPDALVTELKTLICEPRLDTLLWDDASAVRLPRHPLLAGFTRKGVRYRGLW
jgi:hypothetical protein